VAGRIQAIEKSNDLTGNRNHNLLACDIAPQLTIMTLTKVGTLIALQFIWFMKVVLF
jgi:hypothetical protein